MAKDVAKLVSFGNGGDTVYYGAGCTGSGYGDPDRPHAADPKGREEQFPDGTPALDKRPALDTDAGYRFVFSGPMVNVDLPAGEVDECPDLSNSIVARAVMSEPGNGFGTLAAIHQGARAAKRKYGSLDFVDAATYIRLWRELGARVGQYQGGRVVWES